MFLLDSPEVERGDPLHDDDEMTTLIREKVVGSESPE